MTYCTRTIVSSLAISALVLSLSCAPLSTAQAGESAKIGKPDSRAFTVASLNGLYAYANLAVIKAGYGMLKLDGRGNVSTDGISLSIPDGENRLLIDLGPGTGTYNVDPNGLGKLEITFLDPDPDVTYRYEFVIKKASPAGKHRVPLATEVFASSDTTGVANASVTLISALERKTGEPVAKFNLASIEGRYAYTNNADYFASYGVLVFDGKGNVVCDGLINQNAPDENGERIIRQFGPCGGTYTVDPHGRGALNMDFGNVPGRTFTYEFVITRDSYQSGRRATLATELFSAVTVAGISGQLVAPTMTRIFPK